MAPSTKGLRRRVVVCVDGTWYNEDGLEGYSSGNQSNVFRIWASIKTGHVTDADGNAFEQVRELHTRFIPAADLTRPPRFPSTSLA